MAVSKPSGVVVDMPQTLSFSFPSRHGPAFSFVYVYSVPLLAVITGSCGFLDVLENV